MLHSRMKQQAENSILRTTLGGWVMELGVQILLVEDDDDLRGLLHLVLRGQGYSVTEARTVDGAMGVLRIQRFDVVLLDITLPDGNGYRIAELLRMNNPSCKVIVTTGTIGLVNALRGATVGVQDYIAKPFTIQHLLRSIKNALAAEVTS